MGIGYDHGGGGALLSVSGTFTNTGLLTIAEGVPSDGGGFQPGGGGVVQDSGVFTNSGIIDVSGAVVAGPANGQEGQLDITGQFTNTGAINLYPIYGYYNAQMTISPGATLFLSGAADISNGGVITDNGVISGNGTIDGQDLVNSGKIIAVGGLLTIDGAISGNGKFALGQGGTLDINGTIYRAPASLALAPGSVDPRDLLPALSAGGMPPNAAAVIAPPPSATDLLAVVPGAFDFGSATMAVHPFG